MKTHSAAVWRLFEETDYPADAFYGSKVFADRKIIIYGAGEGFHWVQEILMRHYRCEPSVVLDRRFTRGDFCGGLPAFSPLDYRPSAAEQRDAIVVICVGKREYHAEITRLLQEMGFKNIILMMDVYEIHNPLRLPDVLEKKGFHFYLEQKEQILKSLRSLRG